MRNKPEPESVTKQKDILDILERFAKRTKIKWLLRENDLVGLSHHITEQFYNVHCSCGHWINSRYQKDYIINYSDGDGEIGGCICESCIPWYKENFRNVQITDPDDLL